jgi:hypothetical protein
MAAELCEHLFTHLAPGWGVYEIHLLVLALAREKHLVHSVRPAIVVTQVLFKLQMHRMGVGKSVPSCGLQGSRR